MPRKSRQGQQALRLFLAVYPPADIAQLLLANLRALPSLPPYREIPVEQIHLTLFFIGDIKARELDSTVETIDRAKKSIHQFDLAPHTLRAYPLYNAVAPRIQKRSSRQRSTIPRLIAAETDAPPDLLHLHERLVKRLSRRPPRANPNDRYQPHFTLCRFRSYRAADYDLAALNWVTPGSPIDIPTFTATSFALVKSTLQPTGPTHDKITTWPLSPHP